MTDNLTPEKKQDPIKVGDVVVSRWVRGPGGLHMTVRRTDSDFIACCWTDEFDRLRESVFRADELRLVE
jgi:uncharacterized protein YodC (DUF2158 family)